MSIIECFIFGALLVYLLRVLLFRIGVSIERAKQNPPGAEQYRPFVSVIVPARNEEANIARCVRSVMACAYPPDSFELIVVNDRSEDATARILAELMQEYPALRIVETADDESNPNLQGKTRALHQGIAQARGEILMMTDADCTVAEGWISRTVQAFADPTLGMVASYTVVKAQGMFEKLQALEWLFNHTLASGGVGLRQPLGCFGNNISLRRAAYEATGGYAAIRFSVTEDLALLQAVARTAWKIRYICDNGMKVTTLPAVDFMTFVRQHQRWAKGGKELGWRALIFVLSTVAIWLALLLSLLWGGLFWFLGTLLLRTAGDFWVLSPTLRELRLLNLRPIFPLAVLMFLCIEAVIPTFLLRKKVRWKGREFVQG